MEYYTLNNGVEMPKLGLGVFLAKDLQECEDSVVYALRHGYRMVDTAASYGNEEAVGNAIKRCGVPRDEIFVTTKVRNQDCGYEATKRAFDESMEKLQLDYLDLYLIHHPYGDYYGAWRAMEDLYREGRIRAIGVANFNADRIVDLVAHNEVVPAVDQVEFHPYFQQAGAFATLKEYGIRMEAWSPLGGQGSGILSNETLIEVAERYGKSSAQVILRWDVQRGVVTIPKSVHANRLDANIDVFDFELSDDDMAAIAALDTGRPMFDLTDPGLVKALTA